MTTIGIDCRFAATESGLGRYTRELVAHLLRRDDALRYALFVRDPSEPWLASLPPSPRSSLHTTRSPHYSLSEQLRFPLSIRSAGADFFFSPHFNVPLLCPVPFVVTVHDLILHRFPNEASPLRRIAYRTVMQHAVARARAVIAVSRFTGDEICGAYGERVRSKIAVISEGVSEQFRRRPQAECAAVLAKHGLPAAFFLYVGNAKQHKNVQTLIDAFAAAGDPQAHLVLVTGGGEASRLRLRERVRLLPDVDDADLPVLYSAARAFVTASLYEGFCLPVAEAAACGCPIVATRRGAIPEVAPPGALLVEPTIEALARALRAPPLEAAERRNGSWSDAAEQTAAVLAAALR